VFACRSPRWIDEVEEVIVMLVTLSLVYLRLLSFGVALLCICCAFIVHGVWVGGMSRLFVIATLKTPHK